MKEPSYGQRSSLVVCARVVCPDSRKMPAHRSAGGVPVTSSENVISSASVSRQIVRIVRFCSPCSIAAGEDATRPPGRRELGRRAARRAIVQAGRALDRIIAIAEQAVDALETLRTFGVYHRLDSRIRALENSGDHVEAVRFCLSMKPGESNWAFFKFDESLGNWLALNQEWMVRYRERAFADVAGLQYAATLVALSLAALVHLGLRPRLREYGV